MGRKIPGRKHRGVKDPEKQQLTRFNSLKGKINAPPTDPDYQEIPKSVNRIAEHKERVKNKKNVMYTERSINNNKPNKVNRKKKNLFEQFKGESDKHFLFRVQQHCDAVIREKAFENKYGVDIKRNPNTGEVEKLEKKPKDIIDEFIKDAKNKTKKGKNKNKKKGLVDNEPTLTKSQKRQKKLTEKKQQKRLNHNHEVTEVKHESVKFGEVAHAPPTLSVSKKISKKGVPRPGERDLLLKSVIKDPTTNDTDNHKKNKQQSISNKAQLNKTSNKVIDKSGKRKHLPVAMRRRLEKQQTEVINAYRALKKHNNSSV